MTIKSNTESVHEISMFGSVQQMYDEKNYPWLVDGDAVVAHSVHFEMIIQGCRKITPMENGNEKTQTCFDVETYRFATVYPPNNHKNLLFSFTWFMND